jgi:hypothetical protein
MTYNEKAIIALFEGKSNVMARFGIAFCIWAVNRASPAQV